MRRARFDSAALACKFGAQQLLELGRDLRPWLGRAVLGHHRAIVHTWRTGHRPAVLLRRPSAATAVTPAIRCTVAIGCTVAVRWTVAVRASRAEARLRRAAAIALPIERGLVGAAATWLHAPAAAWTRLLSALATLGQQVLGNFRLVEVIVVPGLRARPRRAGRGAWNTDLAVPDGAKGVVRRLRRSHVLELFFVVCAVGGCLGCSFRRAGGLELATATTAPSSATAASAAALAVVKARVASVVRRRVVIGPLGIRSHDGQLGHLSQIGSVGVLNFGSTR